MYKLSPLLGQRTHRKRTKLYYKVPKKRLYLNTCN